MAGNKRPAGPIKYPWWLQSSSASSSRPAVTGASTGPADRRSKLRLSAASPPPPQEGEHRKALEAVDEAAKPRALADEFDRAMEAAKAASIATKDAEDANRKAILIADLEVQVVCDKALAGGDMEHEEEEVTEEEEEDAEEDVEYWTDEDEETHGEERPEVIVISSDDES